MSQARVPHCDCCGLPIRPDAGEDCPRCHYPIDIQKEQHFLETSLRDLQRVAQYGGAKLTVTDLIRRYQSRLAYLNNLQAQSATPTLQAASVEAIAASQMGEQPEQPTAIPTAIAAPAVGLAGQQPEAPARGRERVFSFRTFFADQTINIIASLGAFIGLVGALSFVATTSNLWLSFLVLFLVQASFGIVGIATYRFASFRVVAIIYTVIFALLVPLVGFSGYRLVLDNVLPLSAPTLIAFAASYAAIVYGALAIYQRFKLFGYLSMGALVVAALAIARDFGLSPWWWPAILMLLALPALLAMPRPAESQRPFVGSWSILREPVRVFTFVLAGICTLGIFVSTLYSIVLDISYAPLEEVRIAILSMSVLLLLWDSLALWLTKRWRWLLSVAYLFLACVLACCYALSFQQVGYVLALTGVALLYHGLSRFAPALLARFGNRGLGLDTLALVLVGIVPVIALPQLPLQLLQRAYPGPTSSDFLPFHFSGNIALELLAVAPGLLLTISVTLYRAGLSRTPVKARARWCWLLLLSGLLLNWLYAVSVLALNIAPVLALAGLAVLLVVGAGIVRQRVGTAWANPLDVLALSEIALTLFLSLSQSADAIIGLLLFFAALLYGVLLYQQRRGWLVLPFMLALLASPLLLSRPRILLVVALLLPFASVVAYRFVTQKRNAAPAGNPTRRRIVLAWEWPVFSIGLLYGILISLLDASTSSSTVQNWFAVPFPVAIEVAALAGVWYVAAALSGKKSWLRPGIGFAIAALLFPDNSFWVLLVLTAAATVLAVSVSRLVGRDWALPLYIVAMLGAIMAGNTGVAQHHGVVVTWVLLAFTLLAFIVMLVERVPEWLVFPALLGAWTIWQWQPPLSQVPMMIAYSLLCVLLFASQFVWKLVTPAGRRWSSAVRMAHVLGLGGQVIVVLAIILQGGLSANGGWLAHTGAGALLVLALLLFWYGRLQTAPGVRSWWSYASGLLASLVISWELLAFHQMNLDLLTLAPATFLIVIAPLLSRDETLSQSTRHRAAQLFSLAGALLLLLPTLWLSFSGENTNLLYTGVLVGESLALLMLGIGVRMRVFVLSGAGLLVVGALHALFLPALGIPTSLALTLLGALLLVIATGLSLARRRIQVAWAHWE
ncbi:MAG TPA: hypothetical protein VFQ30_17700 [Ktedonobacteraceae bacterium]|nr:hypothetical protein [Ktedonobacteraceae bacterium]